MPVVAFYASGSRHQLISNTTHNSIFVHFYHRIGVMAVKIPFRVNLRSHAMWCFGNIQNATASNLTTARFVD